MSWLKSFQLIFFILDLSFEMFLFAFLCFELSSLALLPESPVIFSIPEEIFLSSFYSSRKYIFKISNAAITTITPTMIILLFTFVLFLVLLFLLSSTFSVYFVFFLFCILQYFTLPCFQCFTKIYISFQCFTLLIISFRNFTFLISTYQFFTKIYISFRNFTLIIISFQNFTLIIISLQINLKIKC